MSAGVMSSTEQQALVSRVLAELSPGEKYHDTTFEGDAARYRDLKRVPIGSYPSSRVAWLRPSEFCPGTPRLLSDPKEVSGTSTSDIIQGCIDNGWLIAAINVLSTNLDLVRNLFYDISHAEQGVYTLRFYKDGVWKYVVIDDRIPCDKFTRQPIYAHHHDPNEIWVCLLEKAYAKLHGAYWCLEGGEMDYGLRDLTGGAPSTLALPVPEEDDEVEDIHESTFDLIAQLIENGHVIGCCNVEDAPGRDGIVSKCPYGIASVGHMDEERCILLKAPFADAVWTGRLSPGDPAWGGSEAEAALGGPRGPAGVTSGYSTAFWMPFNEFFTHFTDVYTCHIFSKKWSNKRRGGEWQGDSAGGCPNYPTWYNNPQIHFNLKTETEVCILLSQSDARLLPKKHKEWNDYKLSIGMKLMYSNVFGGRKTPGNYRPRDVHTKTVYSPQRSISMSEALLEPGAYTLIPSAFFPGRLGPFSVTVFVKGAPEILEVRGGTVLSPAENIHGDMGGVPEDEGASEVDPNLEDEIVEDEDDEEDDEPEDEEQVPDGEAEHDVDVGYDSSDWDENDSWSGSDFSHGSVIYDEDAVVSTSPDFDPTPDASPVNPVAEADPDSFYVQIQGQKHGPFTMDQVRSLLVHKVIFPHTNVYRADDWDEDWCPAEEDADIARAIAEMISGVLTTANTAPPPSLTGAGKANNVAKKPSDGHPMGSSGMKMASSAAAVMAETALLKGLSAKAMFEDRTFPAEYSSIYAKPNAEDDPVPESDIVWLRPGQMAVEKPALFIDGVAPGDIAQGYLGDCWFLSALQILATKPRLLNRLFVSSTNADRGVYTLRFFKDGEWQLVVIDDRIPCHKYSKLPLFASSKDPAEIWVCLVEKAYAKLHGSYDALSGGFTEYGLRDITGGAPFNIDMTREPADTPSKRERLWAQLKNHAAEGGLLGCSIAFDGKNEDEFYKGLLGGHAYGILRLVDLGDLSAGIESQGHPTRMVKVRNPHGRGEWTGDYSDGSDKWTDELRALLSHTDKEDGAFWMSFDDFCGTFNNIEICRLFNKNWTHKRLAGEWKGSTAGGCSNYETWKNNPHFFLKTQVSQPIFIVLTQPDARLHGLDGHQPIGFRVLKSHKYGSRKQKCYQSESVGQVEYQYRRAVGLSLSLDARYAYVIVPATFEPGVEMPFRITVYQKTYAKPQNDFSFEGDGTAAGSITEVDEIIDTTPDLYMKGRGLDSFGQATLGDFIPEVLDKEKELWLPSTKEKVKKYEPPPVLESISLEEGALPAAAASPAPAQSPEVLADQSEESPEPEIPMLVDDPKAEAAGSPEPKSGNAALDGLLAMEDETDGQEEPASPGVQDESLIAKNMMGNDGDKTPSHTESNIPAKLQAALVFTDSEGSDQEAPPPPPEELPSKEADKEPDVERAEDMTKMEDIKVEVDESKKEDAPKKDAPLPPVAVAVAQPEATPEATPETANPPVDVAKPAPGPSDATPSEAPGVVEKKAETTVPPPVAMGGDVTGTIDDLPPPAPDRKKCNCVVM